MQQEAIEIEGFRLSQQQRSLWKLQQQEQAASISYSTRGIVRIEGLLDLEQFYMAFDLVVKHQEILRTTFDILPGMALPLQVIHEWEKSEVALCDIGEQGQNLQDIIDVQWQQMDQSKSTKPQQPLLQTTLLRLTPTTHLFLISVSALSADKKTLKNFVEQLRQFYLAPPQEGDETNEAMQYADFVEWQYELLMSEDASEGQAFWNAQVQALPTMLHVLGTSGEAQTTATISFASAQISYTLSAPLTDEFEKMTQALETTPLIGLLTCWYTLLFRLNDLSKITIGVDMDGRLYEVLKSTFGLFARFVPVQVSLDEETSFTGLVQQVGQTMDMARTWQDYFVWDDLTMFKGREDELQILPVLFEYEEPAHQQTTDTLTFSLTSQEIYRDRFGVKLVCTREESTYHLAFHYNTRQYTSDEITRLAEQFLRVISNVVERPLAPISWGEIISLVERQRMVIDFNQTRTSYPQDRCLQHLFEEQVERTPEAIAVHHKELSLTYLQLNKRANQLAHTLQTLGVSLEVMVGICVAQSFELMVGLLAILKAGGGYVPLDLVLPDERIAFMIEDAHISVLLAREESRDRLLPIVKGQAVRMVYLDTDMPEIARASEVNPKSKTLPDSLAYMIYTSGSTGKPKGVMIPHGGLVNHLCWGAKYFEAAQGNGVPLLTSIGFDLTVISLYAPLLVGQTIILMGEELGNGLLYTFEGQCSFIKLTPSHLELLSQLIQPEIATGLTRVLVVAGEALSYKQLAFWRTHLPHARIINEYGPTEATVGASVYEVPFEIAQSGSVPIGRPITNTQLYLLDRYLQLVPIGCLGEVYIGGDGVARGYHDRPELTGEVFIPNPFCEEAGMRLYKTGDLARFTPDGNLEYCGRSDYQVKIRGFRVELREIEATLCKHPAIHDAVVIDRENKTGYKQLIAYLLVDSSYADTYPGTTNQSGEGIEPGGRNEEQFIQSIQFFLQERLPEYMVPSAFALLDVFPLTSNGKVDRKALLASGQIYRQLQSKTYVAPRSLKEERLVDIWMQLLDVDRLGIHDNFFAVGGHSLLATQVIARMRKELHLDLAIKDLFERPTVAEMAELIEQIQMKEDEGIAHLLEEIENLSEDEVASKIEHFRNQQ